MQTGRDGCQDFYGQPIPRGGLIATVTGQEMNVLSKKTRDVVLADNMGIGTFWLLEIDGQVITENARPFDAATDSIVLNPPVNFPVSLSQRAREFPKLSAKALASW